jgi:2,4-dienoyl-CoA reductase-like NADH-dependent reductase (Old Yellow Enzyme family)
VIALGSAGVATPFLEGPAAASKSLSLAPLLDLFERGEFDLVALGRALLSEPQWPAKLHARELDAIRPYDKADEKQLY